MRHLFALAVLAATLPATARAQSELVHLRPIDRATVRIMSLRGIEPLSVEGRRTRERRVVGNVLATHGSGVAIAPNLVLTARHVVWGADAWAVLPPGSSQPLAARPVYVDPDHDLAFVVVDGRLPHRIALPDTDRTLTLSEEVSVSGYPLDLTEYTPAAASGEVSRVTRSGALHLTLSVNPGHSGGPVIDSRGRLVGILSARGRPDRGVEGLAVAVPMGPIRTAHGRIGRFSTDFDAEARDLASGMVFVAGAGGDTALEHVDAILPLLERAVEWSSVDADRDAVLAALAWNTLVELLEARNAEGMGQLPPGPAQRGEILLGQARRLAQRALRTGPQVRRRFPVLRAIALGRVQPRPPTQ